MGRYLISDPARRDLRSIYRFFAVDCGNEASAIRITEAISERFAFLAEHPRAGRAKPNLALQHPELRSFPAEDYLILYEVAGGVVRILRVIHARRDLPRLLIED